LDQKNSKCNRETEVYSRMVGFYRPTKLWNKGKKQEFLKRKTFLLEKQREELKNERCDTGEGSVV